MMLGRTPNRSGSKRLAAQRFDGGMSAICVRGEKASLSSGCKSRPATAPAGSNRSSWGKRRRCATRFFRISAANIGPNRFHQNRTVSWLMSIPRSAKRSSTFRSDSGYRTYIITTRRITSGELLKYRNGLRMAQSRHGQRRPKDCSDTTRSRGRTPFDRGLQKVDERGQTVTTILPNWPFCSR
jgi:hypothetical protein